MTLIYEDDRYGDSYAIELDSSFIFISAKRHVDGITTDPIIYDRLSDINPFHRHHIEQLIWKHSRPFKS